MDLAAEIMEMPDAELRSLMDLAYKDLIEAATLCPNTAWHEACFSATYHFAEEMNQRGLTATAEGLLQ